MLCRSERRPRFQREQGFLAVAGLGRCSGRRRAGGIASGSTGEGSGAALSSVARLMLARTVPELRGPMGPWFLAAPGWARICLSLSAQIPFYAAVRGSWLTGGPHVVVRLLRCSASLLRPGRGGVRVRSLSRLVPTRGVHEERVDTKSRTIRMLALSAAE